MNKNKMCYSTIKGERCFDQNCRDNHNGEVRCKWGNNCIHKNNCIFKHTLDWRKFHYLNFNKCPEDRYREDRYREDRYREDRYPEDRYPEDRYREDTKSRRLNESGSKRDRHTMSNGTDIYSDEITRLGNKISSDKKIFDFLENRFPGITKIKSWQDPEKQQIQQNQQRLVKKVEELTEEIKILRFDLTEEKLKSTLVVKKYESIVVQLEKANENIFSLESNKNLEESPAKKRIVLNNSDRDRLEIGLNCVSDYRRSSRIKKINSSMNIIAE